MATSNPKGRSVDGGDEPASQSEAAGDEALPLDAPSSSGAGRASLPRTGALLDGKYRVREIFGEGAMGVVFRGMDVALDREVAIKFFHPHLATESRDLFAAEAKAMAQVRHENVVSVHAFGDFQGAPFFVMEFMPGMSLGDWLAERAPISMDEALGVMTQICRGVQAIHDAGAVHYDLKPDNVLIGSGFRLAVADFGLARLVRTKRRITVVGGSPEYMAPELAGAETVDPAVTRRADVYSLGVMAYELLTGEVPFDGPTVWAVVAKHQTEEPVPPSERLPMLPRVFDRPVLAALEKNPSARPESASRFLSSLQTARAKVTVPQATADLLVADDDPEFLELARASLEESIVGARVRCVTDGNAALQALEEEPADLAIVDLKMPGLNGFELVAALRADPRLQAVRVVVVTAYGGAGDWKVLSSMGASAFLLKPVEPKQLVDAVGRLLDVTTEEPPSSRGGAEGQSP